MTAALHYLMRRLGWAVVVVIGVGTVAFVMARPLPGDPTRMVLGPQARPADVERARKIYGLDQPVWTQYAKFWSRLVHLHAGDDPDKSHVTCGNPVGSLHIDLGFSYRYRQPVVKLIAKKAPRTFELALAALLLQALIGLGAGIAAAYRRGSLYDQLAIGATLIGVSAPTFVLGLLLQYVLAHKLGWLPLDGYGQTPAEQLRSLVLPALTLGLFGAALYARLSRDEVAQTLREDYIRTARAKGASPARVLVVHGLRNALLPIVTLLVLDLGTLIGGAIVTEKLFRWPGLGAMAVDAMVHRDGPVIFGTVLFSAMAIVVATLLIDVLAVTLDPRLRRPDRVREAVRSN
ncbi:MAG: ABC transporter permease [Deltaproteobacteria bacterium]|nr:ABC transporter permease [Deltaproteobacteria bacterium]